MRIPDNVIEEVSRRTDIVELVRNYVTLKPSGSRFMGLCPFHSEKTPSFSVNPGIGAFYCFGCHKGGSVFNFVMEMEGLSFPESVKFLAEKAGVEFLSEQDDASSRRLRAMRELYGRVAGSFAHLLKESEQGKAAAESLADRAITRETIEDFGLGFAPEDPFWLRGFLEQKGYSAEFLSGSGLFTRGNERRSLFAGRIMFPIRDKRGDVVAFGGRITRGDGPKYINSPETDIFHKGSTLYGLDLAMKTIRRERAVLLAEGYMDVLAMHQAGMTNAVAPLGTALTAKHADLLRQYCDATTLVFDSDEAGIRATVRAAELLEARGIEVRVAMIHEGKDPADLLRSGGAQAVTESVASSLSALEFLVRSGLKAHSAASPEGKEFVMRGVFPYISVMQSEVKRTESLRLAADLVGVDPEAAKRDFRRSQQLAATRSGGRVSSKSSADPDEGEGEGRGLVSSVRAKNKTTSHDLFLMLATVSSREHFAYVRQWIQPEDLEDGDARAIYVGLEECFRRDETSLDLLLERIDAPPVRQMIRERLVSGEFEESNEQAIRDGVNSVRRRALLRKIQETEAKLRRASSGAKESLDGEPLDEVELLGEKMSLDRELQKLKGEGG
jgi:DNA primase